MGCIIKTTASSPYAFPWTEAPGSSFRKTIKVPFWRTGNLDAALPPALSRSHCHSYPHSHWHLLWWSVGGCTHIYIFLFCLIPPFRWLFVLLATFAAANLAGNYFRSTLFWPHHHHVLLLLILLGPDSPWSLTILFVIAIAAWPAFLCQPHADTAGPAPYVSPPFKCDRRSIWQPPLRNDYSALPFARHPPRSADAAHSGSKVRFNNEILIRKGSSAVDRRITDTLMQSIAKVSLGLANLFVVKLADFLKFCISSGIICLCVYH